MAATPSLKVVKSFTYRGTVRQFSNRYHFNGGTPADTAHWTTFSDSVVTAEKAIYGTVAGVTIVGTVGYAAGSDVPVFTKTYSTAGTGASVSAYKLPGDVAALIRYSTTARTTKNHPIYLFNYVHGMYQDSSSNGDIVPTAQKTPLTTYFTNWITGFSDGTLTLVRAGPNGATATGLLVEPNFTHRDFPRG